jgi:hypothetical protein
MNQCISTDFATVIASPSEDWSKIQCEVCSHLVEVSAVKAFLKGKRRSMDTMRQFCKHHRRETGLADWAERGYPDIDWDNLPHRIQRHVPALEKILRSRKSHYRERQIQLIRSKRANAMLQQLGSEEFDLLTPGYYGGRGADIMLDIIMEHLTKVMLEVSETDAVLNNCSGQSAGYAQTVLVPELATRLVMEDMNISAEEARRVLVESVKLGDLMNSDT